MERQQLIWDRVNTSFSFVLEEHLVRRRLGGDDIARG
jgi:hypothetical protein